MNRRRFLLTGAAAGLAPLVARAGSEFEYVTDHPGSWKWSEDDYAYAHDFAPDPKEKEAFFANLTSFWEVAKGFKGWGEPIKGFELRPQRGIRGYYLQKPPQPIPGDLFVQHFFYYRKIGTTTPVLLDDESPFGMFFIFNSLYALWGEPAPVALDDGGAMFLDPASPEKNSHPEWPFYLNGRIATRRTAPLVLPISQERVTKAWLAMAHHDHKNDPAFRKHTKDIDRLEALLGKMSEAEKVAPAMGTRDSRDTRAFAKPGQTDAKPLVMPNPDFFDKSLPRSALQICLVSMPGRQHGLKGPDFVDQTRTSLKFKFDRILAALS